MHTAIATCPMDVPRLERSSNHGVPTLLTSPHDVAVCPLPPSRGVYDDASSLRGNHDETSGGVNPTHDTGLFLETSQHGLHWADDDLHDEPTRLTATVCAAQTTHNDDTGQRRG